MSAGRRIRATTIAVLLLVSVYLLPAQGARPLIAVLPFQAIEVAASTAQIIATLFETNLVNTDAYTVLSQNERQQILAAQEESLSDCSDEACAVEIGKLLSAEQVIMGTVAALGKKLIINAKIIDVQTSKTLAAGNMSAASIEELDVACEQLTISLVQKALPKAAVAAKPAAEPAKPAETPKATEAAKPAVEPAKTTTPPAVAEKKPAPTPKPARVVPQRQPAQTVGGLNVAGVALLSGGVILTEAGWIAKSIGAMMGAKAEDAWIAYRGATENLDSLYTVYQSSYTAYSATTLGSYGLWGVGPLATASALFLFPTRPLGASVGGRITFAAGLASAVAGNVFHAMGATFGAQSRDAWQAYATATENLDSLYTIYTVAYDRYSLCSIVSYGLWAVGSLAVPAAFFIPGEKTALAPTLPAKLMVAGGTLLAAAGNYAFGMAAGAQTTAQGAWARYATATENLDTLFGEYETAFAQYRLGTIAAYGLWAAGGIASAAAVFLPWGATTAATGAVSRAPQIAATLEPAPSGVAISVEIRL